jgi:4-amino-4-deoxy-L-arabinose transferase-like glycosyltransferase
MLTLLGAAVTPWAVIEARVGVEAPMMALCLAVAVWCLSRARADNRRRWLWAAGIALAAGVFAYSGARLLIIAMVGALIALDRRWRWRSGAPLLIPVTVAYVALAAYGLAHPGALTHRLAGISIASDQPGAVTLAGRFVRNYLTYIGVPFLATHGDANLRYSTGYGGMFLVATLPAIAVGLVVLIRRRGEFVPRFLLVGLVAAPIPAALTNDGTPQALRASAMLPLALTIAAFGWQAMLPWLRRTRGALVVVSVLVLLEAGGFMIDLYTRYPDRALRAFDAGELSAVSDAHALARGHRVVLSTSLDQAYIQALFALRPDPPASVMHATADGDNRAYHDAVLRPLGMSEASPAEMTSVAHSGDLMVMAPEDEAPAGSSVVERITATVGGGEVFAVGGTPGPAVQVLAVVWRR